MPHIKPMMYSCPFFFHVSFNLGMSISNEVTNYYTLFFDFLNVIRPSAMFKNKYKIRKSFIYTIHFDSYNYFGNLLRKEEEIHAVNNDIQREMLIEARRMDSEN